MAVKILTTIRNKTIGGDICRQRVTLHTQKGQDDVIHINKVILVKDAVTHTALKEQGFGQGEIFKDSVSMSQNFVIRANTLKSIAKLIK